MNKLTDLQRAQIEEVLGQLWSGETTELIVSHLVGVADPHALGALLVKRGEDLLNEGDNNEFAQQVIDVGKSLTHTI